MCAAVAITKGVCACVYMCIGVCVCGRVGRKWRFSPVLDVARPSVCVCVCVCVYIYIYIYIFSAYALLDMYVCS